tara:strand:- start:40277 stop:40909 length:633 start_codon:yes stop_codon:yes gene_type:complete
MAQTLKEEVREKILAAAEAEFAAAGYSGATMASIARAAQMSTGNLYRYYANKDALFYTLFTDEFAAEFLALLRKRVGSLIATPDLEQLNATASSDGNELLAFWIANRWRVVVLLSRARGSRFEDFPRSFVDVLLKPTIAQLQQQSGGVRLRPVVRKTLKTIFSNTIHAIVSALAETDSESSTREAFAVFWSYQLAGLQGLRTWVRNGQTT